MTFDNNAPNDCPKKKLLKLINKFNKVVRQNGKTSAAQAFMNSESFEKEIKIAIPFPIVTKNLNIQE